MKKICLVGGLGHIGLPLGIVLASKGFEVTLLDKNISNKNSIERGEMPFVEYGAEELLKKVIEEKKLFITDDYQVLKSLDFIIVCIGTPVDEYMSPKINPFLDCIKEISEICDKEACIIIRSSIFPGIFSRIESLFKDKNIKKISYCPERIVQGYAVKELSKLPQIVSSNNSEARLLSAELFKFITPKIIVSDIKEAELAKLFSNSWRYIQFSISNQFAMMAKEYSCDYNKIHKIMTEGYERNKELPKAGFSAGPCLLKDTMQLSSFYGNTFLLGQAAMNVNEGYPLFIVEKFLNQEKLEGLKVGILGMAFKPSVDDIRDSLSFRLKKILEMRGSEVYCSDEFHKREEWFSPNEIINKCELIIIACPHSKYDNIDFKNKKVINVWSK